MCVCVGDLTRTHAIRSIEDDVENAEANVTGARAQFEAALTVSRECCVDVCARGCRASQKRASCALG
jgi:hypothetical protein